MYGLLCHCVHCIQLGIWFACVDGRVCVVCMDWCILCVCSSQVVCAGSVEFVRFFESQKVSCGFVKHFRMGFS